MPTVSCSVQPGPPLFPPRPSGPRYTPQSADAGAPGSAALPRQGRCRRPRRSWRRALRRCRSPLRGQWGCRAPTACGNAAAMHSLPGPVRGPAPPSRPPPAWRFPWTCPSSCSSAPAASSAPVTGSCRPSALDSAPGAAPVLRRHAAAR